ncbi:type II toxin-antitoxin system RelE/ParE family toxin [Robiginitomaculum antarcticum]|uniref:type II toxin-antitoxin system RelE/ParE family toxin n=1 Tax=Robiginitomaculum antarcticum TaxID=437507 RepID=UPI00036D3B11
MSKLSVVYLESARDDLVWISEDLKKFSAEGRQVFAKMYQSTVELIRESPKVGRAHPDFKSVRLFPIIKSNYSIVYQVKTDQIIIFHVWDQRRKPNAMRL